MKDTLSFGVTHQQVLSEFETKEKQDKKKPSTPVTPKEVVVEDLEDEEMDKLNDDDTMTGVGLEDYVMLVGVVDQETANEYAGLDDGGGSGGDDDDGVNRPTQLERQQRITKINDMANQITTDLNLLNKAEEHNTSVKILTEGLEASGDRVKAAVNKVRTLSTLFIRSISVLVSKLIGRLSRTRIRLSYMKTNLNLSSDASASGGKFKLPQSANMLSILGSVPKNPLEIINSVNKAMDYFTSIHNEYGNYVAAMKNAADAQSRTEAVACVRGTVESIKGKFNVRQDPQYEGRMVFNQLPGGYKVIFAVGDTFSTNSIQIARAAAPNVNIEVGIPDKQSTDKLLVSLERAMGVIDEYYRRTTNRLESDFKAAMRQAESTIIRSDSLQTNDSVSAALSWYSDQHGRVFTRALLLAISVINASMDYISAAVKAGKLSSGNEAYDSGLYTESDMVDGLANGSLTTTDFNDDVRLIRKSLISTTVRSVIVSKLNNAAPDAIYPVSSVGNAYVGLEELVNDTSGVMLSKLIDIESTLSDIVNFTLPSFIEGTEHYFNKDDRVIVGGGEPINTKEIIALTLPTDSVLDYDTLMENGYNLFKWTKSALANISLDLQTFNEILDSEDISLKAISNAVSNIHQGTIETPTLTGNYKPTFVAIQFNDKEFNTIRLLEGDSVETVPEVDYRANMDDLTRLHSDLLSLGDPLYAATDNIVEAVVLITKFVKGINEAIRNGQIDPRDSVLVSNVYDSVALATTKIDGYFGMVVSITKHLHHVTSALRGYIAAGVDDDNYGE
ncbi:hypothetical protein ABN214_15640 [Proteus terrae]|uniref:hypothetical protein n=1 Tax=Proteus terrae TaxID=1574161 RepID=UPI0032DA853B